MKPPDLTETEFEVRLSPVSTFRAVYFEDKPEAKVAPDGRFTLEGVPPGRYVFEINIGPLKSAIVGGQDTLDFPLEFKGDRDIADAVLTLTESGTRLSGSLAGAAGESATDMTIIVAAADEMFWSPRSRRIVVEKPDTNGRYSIYGLPAGTYVVAAVRDLDPGFEYHPEFLRSIRSIGVPVLIGDGAKVTQNLRVK